MDLGLQKKIYSVLTGISGLSKNNVFYIKADIDFKTYPRYIYSSVSDVSSFDTKDEFSNVLVQISCFDEFQSSKIAALKNKAREIINIMRIGNLKGMTDNLITRCRLDNKRETESDKIFQIDLTFRLSLSRKV